MIFLLKKVTSTQELKSSSWYSMLSLFFKSRSYNSLFICLLIFSVGVITGCSLGLLLLLGIILGSVWGVIQCKVRTLPYILFHLHYQLHRCEIFSLSFKNLNTTGYWNFTKNVQNYAKSGGKIMTWISHIYEKRCLEKFNFFLYYGIKYSTKY